MTKPTIKNEPKNVTIRQANAQDYEDAATLLYITGKELFKYAFYPKADKTLALLRQLFQMEDNEFSYKDAYLAEIDTQVAGLIQFVSKKDMQTNKDGMSQKIINLMGYFQTFKRILRFAHIERLIEPIDEKTLYIAHLATFEQFRGKGVATALLKFCDQQAIKRGFSQLALDVDTNNMLAIQFYKNIGFKVVQETKNHRFYERTDFNFYRVVREVPYSDNTKKS